MQEGVRQRLLNAAARLFAQKGYAGTSTREIVEMAETTKPSLYYYFGNKEGLYVHIVQEELRRLTDVLGKISPLPFHQKLSHFVRLYMKPFSSDTNTVAITLREIFGLGEHVLESMAHQYFKTLQEQVQSLVSQGIDDGELPPHVDKEYAALALLGVLNIFLMRWVLNRDPFDLDRVIAQALTCVGGRYGATS